MELEEELAEEDRGKYLVPQLRQICCSSFTFAGTAGTGGVTGVEPFSSDVTAAAAAVAPPFDRRLEDAEGGARPRSLEARKRRALVAVVPLWCCWWWSRRPGPLPTGVAEALVGVTGKNRFALLSFGLLLLLLLLHMAAVLLLM